MTDPESILKEIEDTFFDIPFGNSHFQIENFIVNAEITPERAFRAVGLQLMDKLKALKKAKFADKRLEIDIEEIKEKLTVTHGFEKRRLEIDLAEKEDDRASQLKLVNDAVSELNYLYSLFRKFPKYTREQFEAAEREHYLQSLNRQINGFVGANEALLNLGFAVNSSGELVEIEGKAPVNLLLSSKD